MKSALTRIRWLDEERFGSSCCGGRQVKPEFHAHVVKTEQYLDIDRDYIQVVLGLRNVKEATNIT